MTTLRQPYYELSPAVYNALVQAKTALENSTLDTTLMELVYLRVSQINGCAFCLEMHSKAFAQIRRAHSTNWTPWQVGA